MGPVSAEALDIMAVDLGRVEERLDTRMDAVIGVDLLARRNLRLHTAERR